MFTIVSRETIIMNERSKTGTLGEDIAVNFLIDNGYKIIERNFRQKWGEIDIIAKDPDDTLVFVEVKTMRQINSAIAELNPEDNLTGAKLNKLQRTAQLFAGKHSDLLDKERGWRIDLLAICLTVNNCTVRHYENI